MENKVLPWKSKSGPPSSVGVLYVEKLFRDLRNLTKTQQVGLGKTMLVTAVGWKQNLCVLCVEEQQVEPVGMLSPTSTFLLFMTTMRISEGPCYYEDFSA